MSLGKRPCNKGSLLLSDDENKKLFQLLGDDNYALSTTVAQLISTKRNKSPRWREIGQGIVCIVKSYSVKKYFLRLYNIHNDACLVSHEVSHDFCLIQYSPFTSTDDASATFTDEEYVYCLNFSHCVDEANHLMETVRKICVGLQKRAKKLSKGSKRVCNNIPCTNLLMNIEENNCSTHEDDFEKSADFDENVKIILEQIGISSVTLNKKERKMIDKIVEKFGGFDAVMCELGVTPSYSDCQIIDSTSKSIQFSTETKDCQPLPSFIKSLNEVKNILQVAMNDLNCCICCKPSVDPILCSNCNLIVGCKNCVIEWTNRSVKLNCPLCRGFNLFLEIRGLTALSQEIREYEEKNE